MSSEGNEFIWIQDCDELDSSINWQEFSHGGLQTHDLPIRPLIGFCCGTDWISSYPIVNRLLPK
jgi:hypothetical protein